MRGQFADTARPRSTAQVMQQAHVHFGPDMDIDEIDIERAPGEEFGESPWGCGFTFNYQLHQTREPR